MSMYKQEYINCDFEVTSPQYILCTVFIKGQ